MVKGVNKNVKGKGGIDNVSPEPTPPLSPSSPSPLAPILSFTKVLYYEIIPEKLFSTQTEVLFYTKMFVQDDRLQQNIKK